jgi:hypothetical protein
VVAPKYIAGAAAAAAAVASAVAVVAAVAAAGAAAAKANSIDPARIPNRPIDIEYKPSKRTALTN